jgi:hypothetical protein
MRIEHKESKKEMTIVGIVREIEDNRKFYRVGIVAGNEIYAVQLNEEGKNLLYEVGNKIEATGIVSRSKSGDRRITVTGYKVYEMAEDDPEEFDYNLKYKSVAGNVRRKPFGDQHRP